MRPVEDIVKDDVPIILECPGCEARYEIPVAIPDGGRKVRCAKCENIWTVQPGDEVRPESAPAWESPDDEELVFREKPETSEAASEAPPESDDIEKASEPEPESEVQDQAGIDDLFAAGADDDAANDVESAHEPEPAQEDKFQADKDKLADADVDFSAAEGDEFAEAAAGDDPEQGSENPEKDIADENADFYGDEEDVDSPVGEERIIIGKAKHKLSFSPQLAAGWAGLCLGLLGLVSLAISQRVAVVRAMPGSASIYESLGFTVNVRGLDFKDVAYSWQNDQGQIVLQVHGDIVNITPEMVKVPTVIFGLRDADGVEVYQWTEDVLKEPLPPGRGATFSARIPTPPKSIMSVQVRFARNR